MIEQKNIRFFFCGGNSSQPPGVKFNFLIENCHIEKQLLNLFQPDSVNLNLFRPEIIERKGLFKTEQSRIGTNIFFELSFKNLFR